MHDWYDENSIVGESGKLLVASKVHSWCCYYVGCSDSEFDIFDAVDKERMQEEQVCAFWKFHEEFIFGIDLCGQRLMCYFVSLIFRFVKQAQWKQCGRSKIAEVLPTFPPRLIQESELGFIVSAFQTRHNPPRGSTQEKTPGKGDSQVQSYGRGKRAREVFVKVEATHLFYLFCKQCGQRI